MPKAAIPVLQPRKTPLQARSTHSVEAILQATLQVLIAIGKERLTTTRVAARAGVSVGTLYQYFPNKSALLQACLRQHMDKVRHSIERACLQHRSQGLLAMSTALIFAYLNAKMGEIEGSAALYAVSSDIDGAAISKAAGVRSHRFVVDLFASSTDTLTKDPEVMATVVLAALNGMARRLLETKNPERHLNLFRDELIILIHAYLSTCVASTSA